MVRDDFWMAATRFMAKLEVDLVQGQNCAAVDVFDPLHARKVLAAFGRAYGRLPDNLGQGTKEQDAFLGRAVAGLAQDGKVISVRLALFAEMVKGKPWTPATLRDVGGTAGVGVTFLEETFTASTAPPQHRLHQKAAQAVLKALLPESGTDIKGHMRSQQELLDVSGYASCPKEFDDLLRILDSEIRLITPTDPEGKEVAEQDVVELARVQPIDPPQPNSCEFGYNNRYYQLTHDYLVPSLRDWLTRKQKETRRGRAELLLADRAAVWNARPEYRQLPSLLQWLQIRWYTRKRNWTPPQRKLMHRATRFHLTRGAGLTVVLAAAVLVGLFIWEQVSDQRRQDRTEALVKQLLGAEADKVEGILDELKDYRARAEPLLRQALAKPPESREHLHASLALLPGDPGQAAYLYGRLLQAVPVEVPVISKALGGDEELRLRLWGELGDEQAAADAHLRAACALAGYPPAEGDGARWRAAASLVTRRLLAAVQQDPAAYAVWRNLLWPVRDRLAGPLGESFRNRERPEDARTAASLLADYLGDQPAALAKLLLDADEKQFAVIFAAYRGQGEKGVALLTGEIDKKLPADLPSADVQREKLAKQQANAAVALLRMGQPEKVWPLLQRTPPDDPRVRSYLIHRLSPLGADAEAILQRLNKEPDLAIRRALLLSLGEYGEEGVPAASRPAALAKVRACYRSEEDPGLHAAAEWLLRQWKPEQEAWLRQVNEDWAKDREGRDKRLEKIQDLVKKDRDRTPPQWYVNSQGQTMVVVPGPVEFLMGSPATEEGRTPGETQHKRRIGRSFALAAKAVTVREFGQYLKANKLEAWFDAGGQVPLLMKRFSPDEEGPIVCVDWYRAAAYCNWLSKGEGLTECYDIKRPTAETPEVTLKANYLSLSGYRLPTEAEMEYATRARAVTSRYYGETEELLEMYSSYMKNGKQRTWPVGRKKPNDLGLFDLHGNVYTWCQEIIKEYPSAKEGECIEDKEDLSGIQSANNRVMRGGSCLNHASLLRCANRNWNVPAYRNGTVGLRPARTFAP
jgi:formylglycine-generating enzyme required for sulfatase activity